MKHTQLFSWSPPAPASIKHAFDFCGDMKPEGMVTHSTILNLCYGVCCCRGCIFHYKLMIRIMLLDALGHSTSRWSLSCCHLCSILNRVWVFFLCSRGREYDVCFILMGCNRSTDEYRYNNIMIIILSQVTCYTFERTCPRDCLRWADARPLCQSLPETR